MSVKEGVVQMVKKKKKKKTLWARRILLPSRHFENFAQILEVCLLRSDHTHIHTDTN